MTDTPLPSTTSTSRTQAELDRHTAAMLEIAAADDAAVAALTAEVQRLLALIPPAPPEVAVGWSLGPGTPAGLPAPAWVRTYLGKGQTPHDYRDDGGLTRAVNGSTQGLWVSFKDDPGLWLPQLVQTVLDTGRRLIVTYRHEPQNDQPLELTGYHDGWGRTLELLSSFSRVHELRTSVCHMSSKGQATWGAFDVPGVDLMGFDVYNKGATSAAGAKSYQAPADLFGTVAAYAKAAGLPLAIGETGSNIVAGLPPSARAAWAEACAGYLDANGCAARLWWSSGTKALDAMTAEAWSSRAAIDR